MDKRLKEMEEMEEYEEILKATGSINNDTLFKAARDAADAHGFDDKEIAFWQCNVFSQAVSKVAQYLNRDDVELVIAEATWQTDSGDCQAGAKHKHVLLKFGNKYVDFTLKQIDEYADFPYISNKLPKYIKNPNYLNIEHLEESNAYIESLLEILGLPEDAVEKATGASQIKFTTKSTKGSIMKELLAKNGIKVTDGKIARADFNKAVKVLSCNMSDLLLEGKKLDEEFAKLYADESKKDMETPKLLKDGESKDLDKAYKDPSKQKIKEKIEDLVVKKPASKELDSLYKAKAAMIFSKEEGFEGSGVYLIRGTGPNTEIMAGPFSSVEEAIDYRDDFDKSGYGSNDKDTIKAYRLNQQGAKASNEETIEEVVETLVSELGDPSKLQKAEIQDFLKRNGFDFSVEDVKEGYANISKAKASMKDLLLTGKELETKKLDKLLVNSKKDKTMKVLTETKEVLEDGLSKIYDGKERVLVVDSKVPLKKKTSTKHKQYL